MTWCSCFKVLINHSLLILVLLWFISLAELRRLHNRFLSFNKGNRWKNLKRNDIHATSHTLKSLSKNVGAWGDILSWYCSPKTIWDPGFFFFFWFANYKDLIINSPSVTLSDWLTKQHTSPMWIYERFKFDKEMFLPSPHSGHSLRRGWARCGTKW